MILKHKHPCVQYMCKSKRRNFRGEKKSLFALTRTTQCCVHMILQAWLCLCQVFSGSEQYEKVRHSNRISQYDLFTPRLSLLHCPPLTPVIPPPFPPGTVGAGWHPRATRPEGRVTAAGASAHMF